MSAFIGPIHYWLYSKIQIVNNREDFIYQKLSAVCGDTVEELREQVWQTYGKPLPKVDLAELIEHDNIHGWLQRQINLAESREAALIKETLAFCGATAKDLIKEAFKEHGAIIGNSVQNTEKYDTLTAKGLYVILNDYYLNGMPCEQADMVIQSDDDSILWRIGHCLQEPNWKRVNISPAIMLELYQSWLEAFVGALNNNFSFRVIESENSLTYEIFKN